MHQNLSLDELCSVKYEVPWSHILFVICDRHARIVVSDFS
jgi:hypothetical protein